MRARGYLLPVLLLILVALGCGSSNTGTKATPVPTSASQTVPNPTAAPAAGAKPTDAPKPVATKSPEVFKIGDNVKVQEHTISVLSAKQDGGKVLVETQIANTGNKDLSVSSMMSFNAKATSGQKLSYSLSLSGGSLDGKVLPGDKLKGTLAYSMPAGIKGLKLYYTPDLFGQSATVFALDDEAFKNPWPKPADAEGAKPFAKGTIYQVGDAVSNKDLVIKLNSAKLDGGVLKAQFTMYNGGQKDASVSSMMSFDAKDSDGTKGKYKLSMDEPSLDGRLVPGDTLKGSLAFEFAAGARGVKLYFTDSLFGGDTIVFATE